MRKRMRLLVLLTLLMAGALPAFAQDTASITGTVTDKSGAVVPGATVTVTSPSVGVTRTVMTNPSGAYLVAELSAGTYILTVSAAGFKQWEADNIVLRVAQNARVDVKLTVGEINTKVVVEGSNVAQVETQSSEIGGTITGTEINQLELNGRNFTQLVTLVPGVSNQTGLDDNPVGAYGNVSFSFNGGREEYNNWQLDGGDLLDNGSNDTIDIFPSLDSIGEVQVLTSNYGAQYGKNGSGTIIAETKSGTNQFHGDVYEFVRNDMFNARNFFDQTTAPPSYKKNDFGYTIGGPIFIPNHYNTKKDKTFFFWSEEWRRESVPGQNFNQAVPTDAERQGNFTDLCPDPNGSFNDCPVNPSTGQYMPIVPVDANARDILAMIPHANAGVNAQCGGWACFVAAPSEPTYWREELIRIDHNITPSERLMFRFAHDSWNTVTPIVLDYGITTSSFPTIQTRFLGPGESAVARLTSTFSSTLMNEFVASYVWDGLTTTNVGPWQRPASMTMTGLFNNGFGGKLPGVVLNESHTADSGGPDGAGNAYSGGFTEDPAFPPWGNSNPTYSYRDNVVKIIGNHNLNFGAYAEFAQKNEPGVPDVQGLLTFDVTDTAVTTGNAFADMLMGNIASYQQTNLQPKYYNRYKIVEPYIQDDWHILPRLTLNLGLRLSLFGTYREKYKQAYNWESQIWNPTNAPAIDPNTDALIDPATGNPLPPTDPRIYNGIVQCGAPGVPAGCLKGHLFNPAPRIGFAWDPFGNEKMAVRGGYGIFFEHSNGNEGNTESLEGSPPLVQTPTQPNIIGYTNIGGGGATPLTFPLGVTAIGIKAVWPYVQQWNLDVQRELMPDTVLSVAYVGNKGTHLNLQRDINQLVPVPASQNPYSPGEAIDTTPGDPEFNTDCNASTPGGQSAIGVFNSGGNETLYSSGPIFGNLNAICGNSADPYRPFTGFSDITSLEFSANSIYNALQVSLRRTKGPLTMSLAYTYSHSIDDSSDRYDGSFVNSYNLSSTRASSNFDQRHMLNITYVYDFPNFGLSGWQRTAFAEWEISGITSIQTGIPFTVTYPLDNAGVASALGSGSYPDVVGDPNAPASSTSSCATAGGFGPTLYDCAAFAAPRGLTFGTAGRNLLNQPRTTNFDMALFKHFPIHESVGLEFRAEAFNVFNHTEWSSIDGGFGEGTFLHPTAAHRARTLQLGMKLLF
jgi:Carboxypeptidase regulatory-like domain